MGTGRGGSERMQEDETMRGDMEGKEGEEAGSGGREMRQAKEAER